MVNIAQPSAQSLMIQMRFNGHPLSTGTAFTVQSQRGPLLITNRHNVTDRHQETNQPLSNNAGLPNELVIVHNANQLGTWVERTEPLYQQVGGEPDWDQPLWIEHPVLGAQADFVAIRLSQTQGIVFYHHNVENNNPDIFVGPADSISVIGFPFGLSAGGAFGVWATGFMASEPELNYNNLPLFLIDCRSRQGQSGSPVIAYRGGGMVPMKDGGTSMFGGPVYSFLGIYSGRINAESDLGIVWKREAIKQLVDSIR